MIRTRAQLTVSRFCELIGLPRSAYYAQRERHLTAPRRKGPWPTPVLDLIESDVVEIALARPTWGHRRVWAELRARGHEVAVSSVKRVMERQAVLLTGAPHVTTP